MKLLFLRAPNLLAFEGQTAKENLGPENFPNDDDEEEGEGDEEEEEVEQEEEEEDDHEKRRPDSLAP